MIMKFTKWPVKEQAMFLKRIGELLERGYPLAEAVESILYYLPQRRREEIGLCLLQLKEGYSFYKILTFLQFDSYLIGYVYFSEQHGGVARAFQDGSRMIIKRHDDLDKLKRLFFYPILLLIITLILFIFVDQILIPQFSSLFQSMDISKNFFMHVVILFGKSLPIMLYCFLFLVTSLILYYYFIFRKFTKIEQKRILVGIPIIGGFFSLFYTHYVSVQLSYLLSSGLSILEGLTLFERNNYQPFYKDLGHWVINGLKSGDKFEDVISDIKIFERDLTQIIRHGQENGKLDEELLFYSNYCLRMLEEKTDRMMKKVQPCLYSLIGLLIVSIYLAVLLPMFHLLNNF